MFWRNRPPASDVVEAIDRLTAQLAAVEAGQKRVERALIAILKVQTHKEKP